MSIKQAQRITSATINAIEEGIWKQVAIKAVTKMPRIQLTNQSNKLFQDFALMNGHDPKSFLRNLSKQNEKKETFIDNLLTGGIKAKPCIRKFSDGDLASSQYPKRKPESLNIRITNRSKTQVTAFLDKSQVPKICTRLFVSQLPNEEYQDFEAQMRKTKAENIRYNTRLQEANRERLAKSEQHTQNEAKKFKQVKAFTYDYEGKLMGMKAKQNGNIKFVHVKAKFHQSAGKQHRSFIEKLQKSKLSQITQKKVINGDDYAFVQPIREERYSKNIPTNLNNSLYDLFKDDRSIQMGVSIIDKANNSKLVNRQNPMGKSVKLCDFKKSFKSSSIVGRKKQEKLATLQSNSPNLSDKDLLRVNTVSDAQSKILSSAFSRYSKQPKQLGKISINNSKVFMDSFQNDHSPS